MVSRFRREEDVAEEVGAVFDKLANRIRILKKEEAAKFLGKFGRVIVELFGLIESEDKQIFEELSKTLDNLFKNGE